MKWVNVPRKAFVQAACVDDAKGLYMGTTFITLYPVCGCWGGTSMGFDNHCRVAALFQKHLICQAPQYNKTYLVLSDVLIGNFFCSVVDARVEEGGATSLLSLVGGGAGLESGLAGGEVVLEEVVVVVVLSPSFSLLLRCLFHGGVSYNKTKLP